MSLKLIEDHGFQELQSEKLHISPYFLNTLRYRVNKKLATNIVVTGEAGIGKSYMAIEICRRLEGKTSSAKDRFSVDQVVFTYTEFMELVLKLRAGKPIIFDEPSYAMGKREWYKDLNKALTQTIESFRFKMHPLVIPIINKSLLDKTVRDHLIQYQINVVDRGKAVVYRLRPSQFVEKMYHENFCELYVHRDFSKCPGNSCLDCPRVELCDTIWAQYERKKASIQESRYEQAKERAEKTETRMMTLSELEPLAISCQDKWLIEGRIHVQKLRIALKDTHDIQLSMNKAYHLKSSLEAHFPEMAPQ